MKMLTTSRHRVVIFHDLQLIIPAWANYVAVDSDGSVWAYEDPPVIVDDYEWRRVTGTYTAVCDVELAHNEDWRKMLLSYKDLTA